MSLLLAFISGVIFFNYIIPILDCFVEIVSTIKSVFVTKKAVIVAKDQSEISKIQIGTESSSSTNIIGFQIPNEEYYEDNEGDYEERFKPHQRIEF